MHCRSTEPDPPTCTEVTADGPWLVPMGESTFSLHMQPQAQPVGTRVSWASAESKQKSVESPAPSMVEGGQHCGLRGRSWRRKPQKGKMHRQALRCDYKVNPPFWRKLKRPWSSNLPGAAQVHCLGGPRNGPSNETPF